MRVYELGFDGSGEWISFSASGNVSIGEYSKDNKLFSQKVPLKIEQNEEGKSKSFRSRLADFSTVNYAPYPCFSSRAKAALEEDLEGLGQWLELKLGEVSYWLFNISNIIDAIDEEASIVKDLGSVKAVKEFAFRKEVVDNQLIFKILQRPGSHNLVTDKFVNLVRRYQLTGFMFCLLWSDDTGPVSSKLKDYERPRITGLEFAGD